MPYRKTLIKLVVGLVLLVGLALLFLKTVREAASEPYTVRREHLRSWTVAIAGIENPQGASLVLQPPSELPMSVFRQVFERTMESLVTPASPGIPLILRSELEGASAGLVSPEELAIVALEAGLATATVEPRCLALRRQGGPGRNRQIFFLLVDVPGFDRFRREVARLLHTRTDGRTAFEPTGLSPILVVAASDADFHAWSLASADPEGECAAPVALE